MKIQKFNEFKINENTLSKFGYDIKIEGDNDDAFAVEYEKKKLDIIKKYFPFSKVVGKTIYGDAMVDFKFDNNITIKGTWNTEDDTLISDFTIDQTVYRINYHPFDSMGGFNDTQFENDIKEIYENENTYTLVIGHESYAIQNLKSGSLDDINKAITEYKLYVVKGVQLDGKQLGDTTLSVNRTSYKEV